MRSSQLSQNTSQELDNRLCYFIASDGLEEMQVVDILYYKTPSLYWCVRTLGGSGVGPHVLPRINIELTTIRARAGNKRCQYTVLNVDLTLNPTERLLLGHKHTVCQA